MHWRRQWQPTPVFLPGESQGRGAWWAAVYGVAQSQTQLQRLSSKSSSMRFWISSSVSSFFFRTNSLLTSLVSPPTVFPPSPHHSLASSPLKFLHFHIPAQPNQSCFCVCHLLWRWTTYSLHSVWSFRVITSTEHCTLQPLLLCLCRVYSHLSVTL